jgi:hypothetical protein
VPAAFAFASPANKAAVGPVQHFAAMLQNHSYRGLLQHADAATLQQAQPDDNTYVEVVKITPKAAGGQQHVPWQQVEHKQHMHAEGLQGFGRMLWGCFLCRLQAHAGLLHPSMYVQHAHLWHVLIAAICTCHACFLHAMHAAATSTPWP